MRQVMEDTGKGDLAAALSPPEGPFRRGVNGPLPLQTDMEVSNV